MIELGEEDRIKDAEFENNDEDQQPEPVKEEAEDKE